MKVFFLASSLDQPKGWDRYANGFIAQARRLFGKDGAVVVPPGRLRARMPRWHQPFWSARDALACLRQARRADVIHALSEPVAPTAMLLSLLSGKPYLVSVHGTYGDVRAYAPNVRWLYRMAFARACRVVAVSRYTADVIKAGFPGARLAVCPGGFDPPAARGPRRRSPGPARVLSIGAMKARKGFHALVAALGVLKREGAEFRCDIVGPLEDAAYLERVRAGISKEGLTDVVTIHGAVDEKELASLYDGADLFVLPSEHDGAGFEGLGLVYLEALSRGIPVVGARESGAEDVIRDGQNGFLVAPGDVEAVAAAVRRSLDPAAWAGLSASGPKSVETFRWDAVGERMKTIYGQCARGEIR